MSNTVRTGKFKAITAGRITAWADSNRAPAMLAVLLRRLIQSSRSDISALHFPGNDCSQQPGWDGWLEASQRTPWIPEGKSGWEFGCGRDPRRKAEKDYQLRTNNTPAISDAEKRETTFVFVTPRTWVRKKEWAEQKRKEQKWRDVRVYDSTGLETWLEQEIPVQAWFMEELGEYPESIMSVERAWRQWSEVTESAATGKFVQASDNRISR